MAGTGRLRLDRNGGRRCGPGSGQERALTAWVLGHPPCLPASLPACIPASLRSPARGWELHRDARSRRRARQQPGIPGPGGGRGVPRRAGWDGRTDGRTNDGWMAAGGSHACPRQIPAGIGGAGARRGLCTALSGLQGHREFFFTAFACFCNPRSSSRRWVSR